MSQPIKIVVTADTAQAAAEVQTFAKTAAAGMQEVASAAHGSAAAMNQNRMAMMELGHSARSIASGLIAGITPWRMLMMEGPRLSQAFGESSAEMQAKMLSVIPVLGGVAAAVGLGIVAWKGLTSQYDLMIERNNALTDSFKKLPDVLKEINDAAEAGALTPEIRDQLLQKVGLNVGGNNISRFQNLVAGARSTLPGQTNAQPPLHVSLSSIGLPDVQDMHQAQEELAKLGILLKTIDEKGHITYSMNPQIEALDKLTEMRRVDAVVMDSSFDKQRELAKRRHDEQMVQFNEEIAQAENFRKMMEGRLGSEKDPSERAKMQEEMALFDPKKYADIKAQFDADYQAKLDEINQKAFAGDDAENAKAMEANKKIVIGQDEDLANEILAIRTQTKDKSIALYQQEYEKRIELAQSQWDQGLIQEDELKKKWGEAAQLRSEGEKEYTAQLEKELQLKRSLAQADAEMKLRQIQANPYLTESQKAQQSIPAIQSLMSANTSDMAEQQQIAGSTQDDAARAEALEKYNADMERQIELQRQLTEAQSKNSYTQQFASVIVGIQNQWGSFAQQTAHAFQSVFETAVSSISRGISGLIDGTMKWGQALRQIYNAIVGEIVQAIVQMGVRWVMTQLMMAVMGRSILASATAATAPIAAAQAAVWAVPATLATISSYGAAALSAPGFIAAANAMTLGMAAFESGGYTGDGSPTDVAGLVHRGEYVFSAPAVDRIGVDTLAALHSGVSPAAGGFNGGGRSGGTNIHNAVYFDQNDMVNALQQTDAHEKYIVDVMKRNIHKFR